ncbi:MULTISPECIES: PAS domain-containing protein [unclassified Nocardioides]|uniref:PAS domain-containing protein n=1 Tax=unclassified Nocardioides TaxID=2615069 RepID=UPI003614A890
MGLADTAIRGVIDRMAFRASAAPYLLVDTDFRIRAANAAYERATLQAASDMVGEFMFEVFPDNPATPEARGVERLGQSFEQALVSGVPDRMALQRYDVRDPVTGTYVDKSWLPTNSPIRDPDGRTVGVLHHVEDVTHLLVATALERHLVAPTDQTDPAGARPLGETSGLVEALRQDATARRVRAEMLTDQSRRALERMSRRIESDGDAWGPAAQPPG